MSDNMNVHDPVPLKPGDEVILRDGRHGTLVNLPDEFTGQCMVRFDWLEDMGKPFGVIPSNKVEITEFYSLRGLDPNQRPMKIFPNETNVPPPGYWRQEAWLRNNAQDRLQQLAQEANIRPEEMAGLIIEGCLQYANMVVNRYPGIEQTTVRALRGFEAVVRYARR
jgi:hypothetical protein